MVRVIWDLFRTYASRSKRMIIQREISNERTGEARRGNDQTWSTLDSRRNHLRHGRCDDYYTRRIPDGYPSNSWLNRGRVGSPSGPVAYVDGGGVLERNNPSNGARNISGVRCRTAFLSQAGRLGPGSASTLDRIHPVDCLV